MKTVAEINAKVENLKRTMAQVEAQIADKQALIADLKENNAQLIRRNLSKQRKPASLDVQRKKITDLNSEIEELQFVKGRLDKELEQAKQGLSEASIRHRLKEYAKAEAYELSLFQKAQDLLAQYINAISELEGGGSALELLVKIHGDLNGKKLVDYGVDLEAVLKQFHKAILCQDFDPSRIDRLNTSNQNLLNQLDSIHKGKRGYSQSPVRKALTTVQRVPYVDPLRQARLYEKQRVESKDSLKKALEGKTQIIQHKIR
jgi:hypothetical protein